MYKDLEADLYYAFKELVITLREVVKTAHLLL